MGNPSCPQCCLPWWWPLGLALDDGSDAGAAHGDESLLQAVGGHAAALLPPQHQDLLLDGHRVEAVVLLPQRGGTARQAAPGVGDHPREAVGILVQPAGGDTKLIYAFRRGGVAGFFLFISTSSCLPVRSRCEMQRISSPSRFSQ